MDASVRTSGPAGRNAALLRNGMFIDDLLIETLLGQGSFGCVFLGKRVRSDRQQAIKILDSTTHPSRVVNEVEIMKMLGGESNIVRFFDVDFHNSCCRIYMEYFRHGDFREYLPRLSLEQIQSYMFQLMTALAYLHNKGVIHRDVKPKNFLFNSETGDGRLIDFGLAEQAPEWQSKVHAEIRSRDAGVVAGEEKPAKRRRSSKTEPIVAQEIQPAVRPHMKPSRAGTFGFRAPEVLIQKLGQTPALDIWSAGIIFLCLLSRKYPLFPSNTQRKNRNREPQPGEKRPNKSNSREEDMIALLHIAALRGPQRVQNLCKKCGMVLRGLPSCRTLGSPKSLRELVHTDFLSEPLHSASGSDLAFSSIVQPSILSNDGLYLLSSHQLMSEPPSDATSSASDLMLQTPMDHAVDLVERMLDVDPDSRVSATQALVHPFLTRSSTSQSMLAHVPAADSLLADVSLEIPVPVDMASGLPMGTMTVQNFVSHPGMYGPTGFPSSSVGMQSISRIASLSPG